MNYLIDILLIAILVFSFFRGFRKGIILGLRKVICFAGSAVLSFSFSGIVGDWLYQNGIGEHVRSFVLDAVSSVAKDGIEKTLTENPTAFDSLFSLFHVDGDSIRQSCLSAVNDVEGTLTHLLADPIAEKFSKALAFLGIFILSSVLISLILILLNSFFKLPVLKNINKVLGGILGLVCGVLYCYLFVGLFNLALPYLSGQFPNLFPTDFVQSTFLFEFINQYNIFSKLFSII